MAGAPMVGYIDFVTPTLLILSGILVYLIIRMLSIPRLIATTNELLREQIEMLKRIQADIRTQKKND